MDVVAVCRRGVGRSGTVIGRSEGVTVDVLLFVFCVWLLRFGSEDWFGIL